MEASDALTVIAEISIGLAGFAGIVVAFRQRSIDAWQPQELIRLRYLLNIAFATLFFSLFPFIPYYLGMEHRTTWVISSAVLTAALLAVPIIVALKLRTYLERLHRGWLFIYVTGSLVAGIVVVTNCFYSRDNAAGFYLVGLIWLLMFASSVFIRLIMSPMPSDA